MKQKITKYLKQITALAAVFVFVLFAAPVNANTDTDADAAFWKTGGEGTSANVAVAVGLGTKTPIEVIVGVINVVLGFLGIIAVIIILLGGFKWMTAQGNEDKVEEARNLIIAGVIGLVIIMSAFGIAQFVIGQMKTTTGL